MKFKDSDFEDGDGDIFGDGDDLFVDEEDKTRYDRWEDSRYLTACRTWEEVASEFSRRNPDDPLTDGQVRAMAKAALNKLRKLLKDPGE